MSALSEYMRDKRREMAAGALEEGALRGNDECLGAYIELNRQQFRHDFWEGSDGECDLCDWLYDYIDD